MHNSHIYYSSFKYIPLAIIILFLLSLTEYFAEDSNELVSNILVERSRPHYEIFSFDYDPVKKMIYFIEFNSSIPEWESTPEKPSAILRSYNLNLENNHPELAKDIYTKFNVSNPESIWLQFGTENNMYVHDIGVYDATISTRTIPAQILEFKNDKVIAAIPIFTGLLMTKEFELENKLTNFRERNKQLCSKVLANASNFVPLGYYYTDDVAYTKAEKKNFLLPKYLKLKYKDTTYFVTAEDCGINNFKNYRNKFKHKKNLAQLNNATEFSFNEKNYQLNNKLYITKKEKSFQWLVNFKCEKYYNILNWNKKKYNLGSCAKSYINFPTSLNAVTKDGHLIYARMKGIYTLKP